MKSKITLLTLLLASFIILSNCKNDKDAPLTDLQLKISPDTLIIMDSDTLKEIFLSTQPQGKIDYIISQVPEWLSVEPLRGNIQGNLLSVKVRPLINNMNEGIYSGKISVISNIAGTAEVFVRLSVKGHPVIKTNIFEISFPENTTEAYFDIENIGTGLLSWSINNSTKWIHLSRSSGYLAKGEINTIKVTCDRTSLDINTYTSKITINSNSDNMIQPLNVSMVVPEIVSMQIKQKDVLFDYFTAYQDVYLKNTGNTGFTWSATNENYFTLTNNNGTLVKGDSIKIKISLDRTTIQAGTFGSNILISYDENGKDTIKAQINHFKNTKWILDRNIIDAEFCRETNKIIIVSSNPDRLSIIDPDLKTIENINLNSVPKCVSVNKNGDHAAVGHNGLISFVNLTNKSIEEEFPVSCDALDIILTTSNWTYIFPVRDQWQKIRCINLQTGAETLNSGNYIYAGTLARLHPSENWIYGANNGLSPSDIEKYSIENGTAAYLYDSPYHGDYPMNGNVWFSEDGDRIFTKGKTVVKTSIDKTADMIYNGSVSCTDDIRTLFHSKNTDKFFIVTQSGYWSDIIPASEVLVYNYTYLNYLNKYSLEPFLVPVNQTSGKLCNSEGNFVYANKEGTMLYIIVQASKSSGLLNDWAIQNIEI